MDLIKECITFYLINFFVAVTGSVHGLSLVMVSGGYSLVVELRLPTAVTYLVAGHRFEICRLSSCST